MILTSAVQRQVLDVRGMMLDLEAQVLEAMQVLEAKRTLEAMQVLEQMQVLEAKQALEQMHVLAMTTRKIAAAW